MKGKELNAIYDGYTWLPFYMGNRYGTSFAHLLDYEPAPKNHIVPQYGLLSKLYFGEMIKGMQKQDDKYSNFKKT
jgi:hypothetical protein